MKSEKRGFTLIELLVVVAIIGLLASIVLASLNSARKKARDSRRMGDVKSVQNALELYANDNGGVYPRTANDCSGAGGCLLSTLCGAGADQLGTTYMAACPVDPTNSAPSVYYYRTKTNVAGTNTGYCVAATLEGGLPTGVVNTCVDVALPNTIANNYGVGA